MSRHIVVALVSIFFIQSIASTQAYAQVSNPYVNVLCAWNPSVGTYEIHGYRQPGQTLHFTITDPLITTQACTSDASDLLYWVQNDLDSNGTWHGANDLLNTTSDVFCPGPDFPTVIGSMMASMSYHTQSGAPQAGLVVNYRCPVQSGGGGGSTPSIPDFTYTADTCNTPSPQALASFDGPTAVHMTHIGPSTNNNDTWQVGLAGVSVPTSTSVDIPSYASHCDQEALDAAHAYVEGNLTNLNPADFGVDIWSCSTDDLVVSITQCTDHGTHSTYGYELDCCESNVPPDASWVGTFHGACMSEPNMFPTPLTLENFTYLLSPTTPVYSDPLTVCQQAETDALTWFDSNIPLGNPCFQFLGAPVGTNYVSGTYHFDSCSVMSSASININCPSGLYVRWRQEFACAL